LVAFEECRDGVLVATLGGYEQGGVVAAHEGALVTCGGSAAAPPHPPQSKTGVHTSNRGAFFNCAPSRSAGRRFQRRW
jgi:hypothetical protein